MDIDIATICGGVQSEPQGRYSIKLVIGSLVVQAGQSVPPLCYFAYISLNPAEYRDIHVWSLEVVSPDGERWSLVENQTMHMETTPATGRSHGIVYGQISRIGEVSGTYEFHLLIDGGLVRVTRFDLRFLSS